MNIFNHGIRLRDYKDLSLSTSRIKPCAVPDRVLLYLKQHEGLPAIPIVGEGDDVYAGTRIATAQGDFSAHVHSSISGTVREVREQYIVVESNGKGERDAFIQEQANWQSFSKEEILRAIWEAGIVDVGDKAIPASLKLSFPNHAPAVLVVNGCESESFLTADYVLMLNHPHEILRGAELLMKASGASQCIIVIEDNKMDVIEILWSKIRGSHIKNIIVQPLPARYPQESESQILKALFPKDPTAPHRAVIFNVATVFAVYEAVRYHKPFFERVVTVTGHCVVEPKNLLCPIGIAGTDVVAHAKGFLREPGCVIYGGPMRGISVSQLQTPTTKEVRGIVALAAEFIDAGTEKPCIRCGLCVEACPENLIPELLIRLVQKKEDQLLHEFCLNDCSECGNCAYVCPSKIPMLHILKEGKTRLFQTVLSEPAFASFGDNHG